MALKLKNNIILNLFLFFTLYQISITSIINIRFSFYCVFFRSFGLSVIYVKNKSLELVSLFYGSLRDVVYKLKKDTGVNISHQTIKNWILSHKYQNKDSLTRFSGYCISDVEWVKIKGSLNYRFTLFDSKQNTVVADEIYSKENSKQVGK